MLVDDIALTLQPKIGHKTAAHLMDCFESAEAVFSAGPDRLVERAQLNPVLAAELSRKDFHRRAASEIEFCQRNGILPIPLSDDNYPELLRHCPDRPHVVYYTGDRAALNNRSLSFVGTRKMTGYGQRTCIRIIEELAEMFPDLTIISGLAGGVDATAHKAAISAGLRTIAVLPVTLPSVYPPENARLAKEIIERGGGLLSECNTLTKVKGTMFIPRNRIIAGISEGTIVVESPVDGGSLSTAKIAHGYNRAVMAFPGRAGDTFSAGTNRLIKTQIAAMVESGADIAGELNWEKRKKANTVQPPKQNPDLSANALKVMEAIGEGEIIGIDRLTVLTGMTVAGVTAAIFELEFENIIRVLPGKRYEKA